MLRMRGRTLLACIVGSGLSTAAYAADLPVYTKAPPPVYSWTGFYVGGNVGYSWGNSDSTVSFIDSKTGAMLYSADQGFALDGVIGGAQFGYNYQIKNWVLGIEADIQASGEKGQTTQTCPGGPTGGSLNGLCVEGGDSTGFGSPVPDTLSEAINWFGTLRARVGPTVTPTLLPYVTGGLAYGEISTTDTVSAINLGGNNPPGVPVSASYSNSTTKVGWTAGAGLEGVISGRWTAKIEYLYMDLGNVSGAFSTPIIAPSGGLVSTSYNSHITDNILRVGVNYRFW